MTDESRLLNPGRLVMAAIRTEDGTVHTGYRHGDIMRDIAERLADVDRLDARRWHDHKWGQGFVDEHGTYYPRHQARIIAIRNGQLPESRQTLTSEDLWDSDGSPLPSADDQPARPAPYDEQRAIRNARAICGRPMPNVTDQGRA